MSGLPRRQFVTRGAAAASGLATMMAAGGNGMLTGLPEVRGEETQLDTGAVRFRPEIEPLVRMIEETSREAVVEKVLQEIKSGRSYKELLAAMFLAGIRNVQPRPAVGFKFHCVLVVYATHQASMAALDNQRWLPLIWAIDNFKGSQATDVREGNWTMAKVNESKLPDAEKSLEALGQALDSWDVEAADAAAAAAARTASRSQLLDVMARYASRDFRSIGHKAIYVAAAFRALEVIGWEHAEPIMRSLAYAILNHQGDENPARHDYAVDQAGRENWTSVDKWARPWNVGRIESEATLSTLQMLRSAKPVAAAQAALESIQAGQHPKAITDAVALASAELVMRQPGIVPLHAVTTTNALNYLMASVGDDKLRKWLLLQNVSFLAHFAEAAVARGKLAEDRIDALATTGSDKPESGKSGSDKSRPSAVEIFDTMGKNRSEARQAIFELSVDPVMAHDIVRQARELIFLKGTDAHDYKFSSAALEDYELLSPKWRPHYLAGCSHLFKSAGDKPSGLATRLLQ